MLSSFLKKLLFARQFFMIDGKIEVLGKRQVMLPADAVRALVEGPKAVKDTIKKDMADYAKKVGSSEEGMLNNITSIFETFGLGKMQILEIEQKRCIVRIGNPTLDDKTTAAAVIAGVFSFLFEKDVTATLKSRSHGYEEYVIK